MFKHHRKLKKFWRDCEVLSMIAGETMTTKAFDKELIRIVKADLMKQKRFKELLKIIVPKNTDKLKVKRS